MHHWRIAGLDRDFYLQMSCLLLHFNGDAIVGVAEANGLDHGCTGRLHP
jgi:hypothetical protein